MSEQIEVGRDMLSVLLFEMKKMDIPYYFLVDAEEEEEVCCVGQFLMLPRGCIESNRQRSDT